MEADMAKGLKIGGKLDTVIYDFPNDEMVITIRAPADDGVKDAVSMTKSGQHVMLNLNPWEQKRRDATPILAAPKEDVETVDLDTLKGEVESVGLIALKPSAEGQKGLAARAAMRTYSRLIEGVDPEESAMYWELANHFDNKAEGGTGS